VTLVGNLASDPEMRQFPSGKSVCQLTVAVGSSYKDADGQWVEKTSFLDVRVLGAQGENCVRYLAKGRQVAIEGRLEQRSWEAQDGMKRSTVEVIANQVMFIGGRGEGGDGPARSGFTPASDLAPANDFKDIDFGEEDDIPF
jgi:single-strand DNA-binding protein